jgi:hypothetical protein
MLRGNGFVVGVEEMGNETVAPEKKLGNVRYCEEKLLFLNFLMDDLLENQIDRRRNMKYDYMVGLLQFVASNPHFKYGYGYFQESIEKFDESLVSWCGFLNAVIADMNSLDTILLAKKINIQVGEFLQIGVERDSITSVVPNLEAFDRVFKCKKEYRFDIFVEDKMVFSDVSDGSGEQSKLHDSIQRLNDLLEVMSEKYNMLIARSHGL